MFFADILLGQLPVWILGFYAVMTPLSIHLYRLDKEAARQGQWRVSERTLFLVDLLGGWIGAVFAQALLRHKSRKLAGKGSLGAFFTG